MPWKDIDDISDQVGDGMLIGFPRRPAAVAEVDELSKRLGCSFPEDYRLFLQRIGSLYLAVDESIWPRIEEFGEGAPHWFMTHYALHVFGTCLPDEPEMMRMENAARDLNERRSFIGDPETETLPLFPVLQFAETSDCYCLRPDGKLVLWIKMSGATPVDLSFADQLEALIEEQRLLKEKLASMTPRSLASKYLELAPRTRSHWLARSRE